MTCDKQSISSALAVFFLDQIQHVTCLASCVVHVHCAQAGPRVCLGKEFAYRQMKIFAAVLVYAFRFEMWEANATMGYRPMLTLKMDGPLYVRASLRQ